MNQGFFSLKREIWNSWIVQDSETFMIFTFLCSRAAYTEQSFLLGGNKVDLKVGQLVTGRKAISSALNVNESKVQRVLNKLEKCCEIEQQTNNKNRLITVVSSHFVVHSDQKSNNKRTTNEQQTNNKRTTNEQQTNTYNKEIKKESNKEIRKESFEPVQKKIDLACSQIWQYIQKNDIDLFRAATKSLVGESEMKTELANFVCYYGDNELKLKRMSDKPSEYYGRFQTWMRRANQNNKSKSKNFADEKQSYYDRIKSEALAKLQQHYNDPEGSE